jgi:hypothetical protein
MSAACIPTDRLLQTAFWLRQTASRLRQTASWQLHGSFMLLRDSFEPARGCVKSFSRVFPHTRLSHFLPLLSIFPQTLCEQFVIFQQSYYA